MGGVLRLRTVGGAAALTLILAAVTLGIGFLSWLDNAPDFDGSRTAEERYDTWASESLREWGAAATVVGVAAVVGIAVASRAGPRRTLWGVLVVGACVVSIGAAATGWRGYDFRRDPPTTRAELAALSVPDNLDPERPPGVSPGTVSARWRGRGDLATTCQDLARMFNRWITSDPVRPSGLPGRCELRGDRGGALAWAEVVAAGVGYTDGRPARPLDGDEELVLDAGLAVGPSVPPSPHPAFGHKARYFDPL